MSMTIFVAARWNKGPQNLIQGVGDYLMRVVGSVPIGFHLTAEIEMDKKKQSYNFYYNTDIVQFQVPNFSQSMCFKRFTVTTKLRRNLDL
jgi:hypothetical protein